MSSLFCFIDFMWRYHGSKGFPAYIVEDGVLGNLAPPGDLEESASHHYSSSLSYTAAALRVILRKLALQGIPLQAVA